MNRVASLFAIVGLLFAVLGLATTRQRSFDATITHGTTAYVISPQFFLYGIAALYCASACLDSIGYFPIDKTLAQWHFWLSTVAVALFIGGFLWLRSLGQHPAPTQNLGVEGTVMAISFLSSIPIFLIAQLWFAVELLRAILRMRRS